MVLKMPYTIKSCVQQWRTSVFGGPSSDAPHRLNRKWKNTIKRWCTHNQVLIAINLKKKWLLNVYLLFKTDIHSFTQSRCWQSFPLSMCIERGNPHNTETDQMASRPADEYGVFPKHLTKNWVLQIHTLKNPVFHLFLSRQNYVY